MLAGDLEGLGEWAADDLRTEGRQKLSMMRLYRKSGLTDDLGSAYLPTGSGTVAATTR